MPFRRMFATELDDDEEFPEPHRSPDGRWPVLSHAERAIRSPGMFGAKGALRDEILELRAHAEQDRLQADADLADALRRRRLAERRIERCNLALVGTHQSRDHVTGEIRQQLGWAKRIPFEDPPPPIDSRRVKAISGRNLRDLILDLLDATGRSLTIAEIERILRLEQLSATPPASRTISDALRGEIDAGRVVRVRRGCYRRP